MQIEAEPQVQPHTLILQALLKTREGLTQDDFAKIPGVRNVHTLLRRLSDVGVIFDSGARRKAETHKNVLIVWFVRKDADPYAPLPKAASTPAAPVRKKARKRVDRRAARRAEISGLVLACAKEVARRSYQFCIDDVRIEFEVTGGGFHDEDARLCGPVMLRAVKLGWCKPTDRVVISERRSDGNARLYESLIFEGSPPTQTQAPVTLESLTEENTTLRAKVQKLEAELATYRAASVSAGVSARA